MGIFLNEYEHAKWLLSYKKKHIRDNRASFGDRIGESKKVIIFGH